MCKCLCRRLMKQIPLTVFPFEVLLMAGRGMGGPVLLVPGSCHGKEASWLRAAALLPAGTQRPLQKVAKLADN